MHNARAEPPMPSVGELLMLSAGIGASAGGAWKGIELLLKMRSEHVAHNTTARKLDVDIASSLREELRKENEELRGRVKSLGEAVETMRTQSGEIVSKFGELRDMLEQSQADNEQLTRLLAQSHAHIKVLEQDNATLRIDNQRMKKDNDDLKKLVETSLAENTTLKQALQSERVESVRLRESARGLIDQAGEHAKRADDLQTDLQHMKDYVAEMKRRAGSSGNVKR